MGGYVLINEMSWLPLLFSGFRRNTDNIERSDLFAVSIFDTGTIGGLGINGKFDGAEVVSISSKRT